MSASPGLLMTLIVILGTGLALLSLLLAATWQRLATLAARLAPTDLDDLVRRLEALEEAARSAQAKPAEQAARRHPGRPVVRLARPPVRVDAAEPSAVSGPTLIAVPNLTTAQSRATASVTRELGRRFGPIWDMADAGESADAIARATGQPIGQIELILALRRQAAAGAAEPRLA